jgi:hypothetical protein
VLQNLPDEVGYRLRGRLALEQVGALERDNDEPRHLRGIHAEAQHDGGGRGVHTPENRIASVRGGCRRKHRGNGVFGGEEYDSGLSHGHEGSEGVVVEEGDGGGHDGR